MMRSCSSYVGGARRVLGLFEVVCDGAGQVCTCVGICGTSARWMFEACGELDLRLRLHDVVE
ncbi:hypothetical protein E2C01_081021 [Portunus trituberculatus]|uniref:Uncharacterized protein n=1 Tax=Portunus trituberculatus TaxID=210409 RepID=A0A5B7IV56_PORTR|nr:hypothetical protein [Portunus trituberculatus]